LAYAALAKADQLPKTTYQFWPPKSKKTFAQPAKLKYQATK
jgi:hypothetical protein